jgi:hypothetical protein
MFYSSRDNECGYAAAICFVMYTLFWQSPESILEHCGRAPNEPHLDMHGLINGKWRVHLSEFVRQFGKFVEHHDRILDEGPIHCSK